MKIKCKTCGTIFDCKRSTRMYCSNKCNCVAWAKRNKASGSYDLRRVETLRRSAARKALFRSNLTQKPCDICNDIYDIEAHHQDYNKPLDVNWLCHSCHQLVHSAVREVIRIAS